MIKKIDLFITWLAGYASRKNKTLKVRLAQILWFFVAMMLLFVMLILEVFRMFKLKFKRK